ncbi:hypothetical protein RTM1035_09708 [Roseovarius sp. TM1035]|uniref:site-specific integrase n=1 Tax=Roseovarius sp. TM1035 TaxID=391613 RepID=UPI00015567FA|nr:site-specific integrase [Roseovarius sp. TM1035]AWZ22002.1 Hypothetical protein RAK1035_3295 [Roseovarius sp. AK1035]EDM29961.1 hypothetical protein RTM1035_09708 [Roseovarius sp. TM1035]
MGADHDLFTDLQAASDNKWLENDFFNKSIAAYQLALHSSIKYSIADLYRSGSWQKYEQRAAALARKHPSRDPYAAYLSRAEHDDWSGVNSRQSYRSALVRLAAQTVLEVGPSFWRYVLVKTNDTEARNQLVRQLKRHLDEEVWYQIKTVTAALSSVELKKLRGAAAFLIQVPPDPEHTAVRRASTNGQKKSSKPRTENSKKKTLYALNQHQRRRAKESPGYDWRSHLWARAVLPDRYLDDNARAAIAVLMLTGCRPSELADDLGVVIMAFERGDLDHLAFEISGAKLAEADAGGHGKGQDLRKIEICCQTPEAHWLFTHVSDHSGGQMLIKLAAPTHSLTGLALMPTERQRRVTNRLGKLMERLGRIAFPRLQQRLSPYVFRHALSSDLRSGGAGWSKEEIAIALGHQSTRTQSNYGSSNTSRGLAGNRAEQVTQVSALNPVRSSERGDPGAPDGPRSA